MQFLYHPCAGESQITIQDQQYQHLYKSRRTKQAKILALRNLKDSFLYQYEQISIDKHRATLSLKETILAPQIPHKSTHLILSVIDSKALQKVLPILNELGLSKLTLFYADYSQRNEKIDLNKLHRILISSCEQCGRSDLCKIEVLDHLEEVLNLYPTFNVFDFGGEKLQINTSSLPILIGPEGGFSPKEKEKLRLFPTFSTQESLILRSESACVYVMSGLQLL